MVAFIFHTIGTRLSAEIKGHEVWHRKQRMIEN